MLHSVSAIKDAATNGASPFWFSPDAMAFWGTEVHGPTRPVQDGALFVTSERSYDDTRRLFTVRHCSDAGEISTVGEFQEHASLTCAQAAMIAAAARR